MNRCKLQFVQSSMLQPESFVIVSLLFLCLQHFLQVALSFGFAALLAPVRLFLALSPSERESSKMCAGSPETR